LKIGPTDNPEKSVTKYINIIYLLNPQLPAFMPNELDSSHKPSGRLSQLC